MFTKEDIFSLERKPLNQIVTMKEEDCKLCQLQVFAGRGGCGRHQVSTSPAPTKDFSISGLMGAGRVSAYPPQPPPPPPPPLWMANDALLLSAYFFKLGYYQPAGPLIKEGPRDSEGERRARDLARYHAPHAHYHTHHSPHHQQMLHHYGAPPYGYGGDLCYSRFYRPQPAPNAYLPPGAPPDSQLVGMGGGDSYPAPPQFYGAPPPPCYQHGPRSLPYIDYSPCTCPMNTCSKNGLIGPAIGNPPTGGGPATNGNNGGAFGGDDDPLAATVAVERLGAGAVPEPAGAPGPPSPARGSAGACTPQPPSAGPRRARLGKAAVRRSLAVTDTAALVRPTAPAPLVLPPAPSDCPIKTERPDSAHDERNGDVPLVEDVAPTAPVPPIPPPVQVAPQTTTRVASSETEPTLVTAPIDLAPTTPVTLETGVKRRREKSKPEVAEIAENAAPVNGIGEHVKLQKRRKVESRQLTGTYKDLISPEAVKVIRLNNGKKQLNVPKETKPTAKAVLKPPSETVTAPPTSKPNKRKSLAVAENTVVDEPPKKKKIENEAVDLSVFRPKNKSALLLDKLLEKNAADREIERVIESVVKNYSSISPPPADRSINNNVLEKAPPSVKKIVPTKTARKESTEIKQIEAKCSERVEPPVSAVRGAARRVSKGRGKAGPRRGRGSNAATATAEEASETSAVTPRWSNGWTWEGEPSVAKVFLNNDESVSVMRRCWAGMVHSRAGDRVSRGDCVLLRASTRRGNDEQPFVARVARLWENPSDGEMMVSLVWYYRPEHTERGPAPGDAPDEVFASRHRDANSVACIEDKCYVLTFNEYCRYRARLRAAEEGITRGPSIVPELPPCDVPPAAATNDSRLPRNIAPELVLFCRKVYDFRSKKIQITNK